jgi:Flp pilus assembly pilin Flp
MDTLQRFRLSEDGQDLVEYSLLLVFIAMAAILILQQTGSSINPVWASGSTTLQGAAMHTS